MGLSNSMMDMDLCSSCRCRTCCSIPIAIGTTFRTATPKCCWQDGADVIITISASLEHGEGEAMSTADKVLAITRAYALQFTDFVIHVNQTGEDEAGRYWGRSISVSLMRSMTIRTTLG